MYYITCIFHLDLGNLCYFVLLAKEKKHIKFWWSVNKWKSQVLSFIFTLTLVICVLFFALDLVNILCFVLRRKSITSSVMWWSVISIQWNIILICWMLDWTDILRSYSDCSRTPQMEGIIMCYDQAESVGSRNIDCEIQPEKLMNFFLFSIVLRSLQLLTTLEPLVRFRWGFHQYVPNELFNQIENWKCHIRLQTDFPGSHHIISYIYRECRLQV